MDPVWQRVDEELTERKQTWAWLARELKMTDQRVNNWKRRGIPASMHAKIAGLLDWSVDRLLHGEWPESRRDDPLQAQEPEAGSFTAVITESEWALLENLRLAPPSEKERLKMEAAAMSEMGREMRREILASLGINGEADAARVAQHLRPAPAHSNAQPESAVKVVVVPEPASTPAGVAADGPPWAPNQRPRSRFVATDKPSGHITTAGRPPAADEDTSKKK